MDLLDGRDLADLPSITEYYKDKTIFITGGTGFMGKVLVEKLLYSCSDLDRIYLLMRPKKGLAAEQRLKEMYSIPCFDRLRAEKPDIFKSKVFLVCGDVMEEGLGLSDEDRALLINRVNIVFHVAASVRFDDPLKYAIKINLCGTKEVLDLAVEMKNLSCIIHVSTLYANVNREVIEEVMYPPLGNWREMIDIAKTIDDHTLRVLTPKILGEVPNTYTFSKQLTEHLVYDYRKMLPLVIYRPSIVVSSIEEPFPGWIDNFNGPVALLIASGAGVMRSMYSEPTLISDYIPVDLSIKGLIMASRIRGTKKYEPSDEIKIYNCCTGKIIQVTIGDIVNLGLNILEKYPHEKILWAPGGGITSWKYINYFRVLFFQLLPAIFIDMLLKLAGKKPMLIKVQRKLFIANQALQYYVLNQWTFSNKNLLALRSLLKKEDEKDFYVDMNIDVQKFFENSTLGGKVHLLKERMENLPKAKAHFRRMKVLDKVVKTILYAYVVWWLLNLPLLKAVIGALLFYCLFFVY